MTLPNERTNAVRRTREFLRELLDPKKTPRISKEIRKRAYYCLKHFPSDMDLDHAADGAPERFDHVTKD